MVKVQIAGTYYYLSWREFERLNLWNGKWFPAVDIVFVHGFILK
jgi:hypothetical protein